MRMSTRSPFISTALPARVTMRAASSTITSERDDRGAGATGGGATTTTGGCARRERGADAREELREAERLGDVILRAELEAGHLSISPVRATG